MPFTWSRARDLVSLILKSQREGVVVSLAVLSAALAECGWSLINALLDASRDGHAAAEDRHVAAVFALALDSKSGGGYLLPQQQVELYRGIESALRAGGPMRDAALVHLAMCCDATPDILEISARLFESGDPRERILAAGVISRVFRKDVYWKFSEQDGAPFYTIPDLVAVANMAAVRQDVVELAVAARAVCEMGRSSDVLADALLQCYQSKAGLDGNPGHWDQAEPLLLMALGECSGSREDAWARLVSIASDAGREAGIRSVAAEALGCVVNAQRSETLAALLGDSCAEVCQGAMRGVGRAMSDAGVRREIENLLESGEDGQRLLAAGVAGSSTEAADCVLDALLDRVGKELQLPVLQEIGVALARCTERGDVVSELMRGVCAGNVAALHLAGLTFMYMGTGGVAALLDAMKQTKDPRVHLCLVGVVRDLGPHPLAVCEMLSDALSQDVDNDAKICIMAALACQGEDAAVATPILLEMRKDPSEAVSMQAEYAIRAIGPAAAPYLRGARKKVGPAEAVAMRTLEQWAPEVDRDIAGRLHKAGMLNLELFARWGRGTLQEPPRRLLEFLPEANSVARRYGRKGWQEKRLYAIISKVAGILKDRRVLVRGNPRRLTDAGRAMLHRIVAFLAQSGVDMR